MSDFDVKGYRQELLESVRSRLVNAASMDIFGYHNTSDVKRKLQFLEQAFACQDQVWRELLEGETPKGP